MSINPESPQPTPEEIREKFLAVANEARAAGLTVMMLGGQGDSAQITIMRTGVPDVATYLPENWQTIDDDEMNGWEG